MSTRSRTFSGIFVVLAAIAGVGAALMYHPRAAPPELLSGEYLVPGRALPDFSLIDHHGRKFTSTDFKGHWSMMFFGYVNCPDFCPTTLSTLAALDKQLQQSAAPVRPRVIFISVDAKRDTPERLAQYVPYFDPQFIGLTAADQPTIQDLAAKLGIAVVITPQPDGSYTVDHSGAIFVVDPAGQVTAILTGPLTVDRLQADLRRIAAAHG